MADIRRVTELLGNFYDLNMYDEGWQHFFSQNNIAMPTAYLALSGYVTPTEKGIAYLNDAWLDLCDILEMDPEGEYASIAEFLE
jgi:hypothetical protein